MAKDLLYSNSWTKNDIAEALKLEGPILVVGASGFIGSNLFFGLNSIRDDVFACSKQAKQSWRLSEVKSSKLINVDILDFDSLKNIIGTIKPKTIFNLSAYGAYSRQKDPEKIYSTNYIGTLNLIRALQDVGCSAFVQAGTSSEYGQNSAGPGEKAELLPNSDYAVSKVGASYLIKYYGKILNFPCANLRLYSAYGPWEERDRLIPTLVSAGLKHKYPNFVDKRISRDFVYIDDCTRAFVRAALTVCKSDPGVSINIASGVKTSLEDVAQIAKKVFKIKEQPEFGSMENRAWDLTNWYGNPELAKKLLDFKTETTLEKGLRLTANWQKKSAKKLAQIHIPTADKKISIIVTCYKDNQSIPILHKRISKVMKRSIYDYEIIFVNDCSPNNDEEAITKISENDSHVIGISHSRNFGSQSAFVSGMGISSGDAVVLMDGDGQDPPEIISDFIKKWEKGYDVIYGQRIKREAPLYMQVFYKIFYRIFRKLSDVNIPVDAGDFSLIDRRAVEHILNFPEKDIFLRGLRAWIGFKQTGVPYKRPERLFGRSTNNFSKNIWWAKKGIFSFSTKPLHYIQTLGLLVFLITIILGLYYLIYYFIAPPQNAKGITTIILLILGIGSIQLISVSILGDYLAKITEEVKNRPKYIRNKIMLNGKIYDHEQEINKIIGMIKEGNL